MIEIDKAITEIDMTMTDTDKAMAEIDTYRRNPKHWDT